ncbi:MAG: 2-succinyl-5-enolpyruvyl-6-hydroxy-3-cyclohexene-1-carboxylic-acid synthase [Muribaculaceae bacterium]|nr:2-succinyl-5-enolpyruvyl-6-hydroxy-3-cyclohexene-1-carboxylic-acid synthase [Muribaculaceae bacterium]
MVDTDKEFCSILLDVITLHGVRDMVCSPGSRNAPLLIAASARDSLQCHVVVDERSAAFMALGMAIVSRRPVALVCTSGTALLNYGPAVAEAYYQGVPLIVISADRPEQWIDQDDSQTLRQFEALSNYVKKSYQLPSWGNDDPELRWYANRVANDAMIESTTRRAGPVHINVRLGEPLGRKMERYGNHPRIIESITSDQVSDRSLIRRLGEKVACSRVMLVAGFMAPDHRTHAALEGFCRLPNVVAMTETLSNLKIGEYATAIDTVLTAYDESELDEIAPDIVISVGGSLVSRKLKEYLRRNSTRCEHWSVGWSHTTSDCFMSLGKRIETDVARFFRQLQVSASRSAAHVEEAGVDTYSGRWREKRVKGVAAKMEYVGRQDWSELAALKIVFDTLPVASNLFLSNGTVVRYAQILCGRMPHASYCNRGVSGIDGSISTAIGGAKIYKGMTVIVTGDMSMAYDVGSLALPGIPDSTRIIVIDNQGGGIFRFIPTTSGLSERERFFCARPELPLRFLSQGYGWEYEEAESESSLRRALEGFYSGGKKILRIKCDGEDSANVLKEFMNIKV